MGSVMDDWFGFNPAESYKAPESEPPPEDIDVEGQTELRRKSAKRRKGRKSTILADLGGDSGNATGNKTVLG